MLRLLQQPQHPDHQERGTFLMAIEIISRSSAKWASLKRYFTGKPCKRGHIVERNTLDGSCTECAKEKYKRWAATNIDRRRVNEKRWRDKNPDYIRAKNKRYKTEHAERLRPINLARALKWAKDNPDKKRIHSQIRRARKNGAEGSHTYDELIALLAQQDFKCIGCQEYLAENRTIDHVIPLSKAGSNWINNLQWLCKSCNSKKHNRSQEQFLAECRP